MKMLTKNRLGNPIRVCPGDRVTVRHDRHDGLVETVAEVAITEAGTFNTAFIAKLEPGDMCFSRGLVGGIAQED